MKNQPYIGFEGPIGAGKTTLAKLLGAHIAATIVLEDVEGNEFLSDFYRDKQRWSLGMQLWFLMTRHAQLAEVVSARSGSVVADYTYAKDAAFAGMLLSGRELRLYTKVSAGLTAGLEQPDLVVYLNAANDVLLERIRRRDRPYEVGIDSDYLDSVREAYERYFRSTPDLRLLRFDTSMLNLDSEFEMNNLYREILRRSQVALEVRGDDGQESVPNAR
jgi:deoxyguanosine kinase